jgi:ZIP family zinc transporter
MSFAETIALGTIAGLTIFLGLPIARLRVLSVKRLAFLNAFAIGVLFFLFVDIIHHAAEPVEAAIKAGDTSAFWPMFAALVGGFLIGLLSLVYYGRSALASGGLQVPQRLAMLIATGLGLHNFSEGLAIGASAQKGEIALALTLVVGFGLHNLTEAFGIAAPLVGQRANWGLLLTAGLVAGGPNFLGTAIGYGFSSGLLSVLFLALAGGALVFVIGELFASGRRLTEPIWNGWGIGLGFLAGLATDLILVAAGG